MAKSNLHSLSDPRHLLRFLKSQAGRTAKDIALEEHVSVDTVKQSILTVEAYRNRNTSSEMDIAVRDLVISSMPKMKETLHGLLGAMELVERKNPNTGKVSVVKIEDKTTRMETMKIAVSLLSALQPKNPAVEVNVNQTNQTANLNGAETNEERFARLQRQAAAHNLLPPEVAAVPAGIDAGGEADDEDDDDDDDDLDDEEDDE
jgi:hypothetical protein